MKILPTPLPGVVVIEPDVYRDERGFFLEAFHGERYAAAGLPPLFVQDNHSRSTLGTLRGLHAQRRRPQGKLIRVVSGRVWDVAVDIRRGSPTFGRWHAVELSGENFRQCYVPPGFAHGFYTLSDTAELLYKCTDYYDPADELRLAWNDPSVAIAWPEGPKILSAKDEKAPRLRDIESDLPAYSSKSAR